MKPCRYDSKFLLHTVGICTDRRAKIIGNTETLGIKLYKLVALFCAYAIYVGYEIKIFCTRKKIVKIGVIGYIRRYFLGVNRSFLYGL